MGSANWLPNNVGGGASSLSQLLARMDAINPARGYGYNFDDLDVSTIAALWTQAGTWGVDATRGFGVWSALSSASNIMQRTTIVVASPAVTPWHVAGRMLCTAATGAGDVRGFALAVNGDVNTNKVHCGISQAVSATKYAFRVVKAGAVVSAISTVNIDQTNWHTHELWFDGVSVWGSVDAETPVLVTTAANCPVVPLTEQPGVLTAAGAAAETFFDFFYSAAGRTAT